MHNITTIDLTSTTQGLDAADTIATHTANTWQPRRSSAEKARDTQVGKLAEDALALYLHNVGIAYRSWDDIRADGFRQHAPLDGFIARSDAVHILHHARFTAAANEAQRQTCFEMGFVEKCEQHGLYGVEVKSTRIGPRHRDRAGRVNIQRILRDDFLQYPEVRSGHLDDELRQKLLTPASLHSTAQRTPFFLMRVYIEQLSVSTYRAYFMGYLTRHQFFTSPQLTVKSMTRAGKSERAIYYAVSLQQGMLMDSLREFINTITSNKE